MLTPHSNVRGYNSVVRALRILVVGINYAPEPTGIAPYTSGMCRGLQDLGHDVRVITAMPHYPQWTIARADKVWARDEVVDGVPVRRLLHYVPARPTGVRRALSELSFGLRSVMTRWGRPDVVVCVSPALLAVCAAIMRVAVGREIGRAHV